MKAPTSPPTTSPSSKRRLLSDEVASHIREQIMLGGLRPGDFIRMEPIAEAHGTSITPVREALLSLSADGFVTAVPRRGFVVEPFTRQDARDLFWAQSQLAGELAARAARRITDEELASLQRVVDELDEATTTGDAETIGRLGHRFHRIVNHAARSERLALLLASIVKHLPNRFYTSIEANVQNAPEEHQELFTAIAARDQDRARALAEAHLQKNADHVIEVLEAQGMWDEPEEEDAG